ncbi:hypothetical protein NEUTE2DRAFT_67508 [Neurospora tetrasperma FGSC 2509]|nr:hypothetical protein NEUTE2DRAFT_67508 [Neurospora tetrasperma FGSC 2509]
MDTQGALAACTGNHCTAGPANGLSLELGPALQCQTAVRPLTGRKNPNSERGAASPPLAPADRPSEPRQLRRLPPVAPRGPSMKRRRLHLKSSSSPAFDKSFGAWTNAQKPNHASASGPNEMTYRTCKGVQKAT